MADDDNTNTTAKKRVSIAAPANVPSRRGGRGGKLMNIWLFANILYVSTLFSNLFGIASLLYSL